MVCPRDDEVNWWTRVWDITLLSATLDLLHRKSVSGVCVGTETCLSTAKELDRQKRGRREKERGNSKIKKLDLGTLGGGCLPACTKNRM